MEKNVLTQETISAYAHLLRDEERAASTVEKYLRDVRSFSAFLEGRAITKELTAQWKEHLIAAEYAPVTINAKLSAVNGLLRFMGLEECRVKFLRIQRRAFREQAKDLTQAEYYRLLKAAERAGQRYLVLLMETICATGIRVSELKYITVVAAQTGRTDVALKGKIRTILLPGKLCRKLLQYAKQEKIVSGEIFLDSNGKGFSRYRVWREMKALCQGAGVAMSKVFPHNLRHLFATTFYHAYSDIVKLADVLGHSSIETTRIYLLTTGIEHARQIDRLGLVL